MPRPPLRVTSAGWATLSLAVTGWSLGASQHWTELLAVGAVASVALALALVVVLVPVRAEASVLASPQRTTVGGRSRVEVSVRTRRWPLLTPRARLEGDVLPGPFRLPTLWPGRTHTEVLEDEARRRGIFAVGPVTQLRSDPLGLLRRTTRWGEAGTLWVRPRVLVPSAFVQGGVFDLEGLPSDQLSTSDLAFHALREYVPGDDLRNVHWRSSAKAATLLVRQYVESRTMHAAFVVDDDPVSYADPEQFELAVSVAASLALRALADGFQVDLVCGERSTSPVGPGMLLDECCHWGLAPEGSRGASGSGADLADRAGRVSRGRGLVGVGVVLTGARCPEARLFAASSAFGRDAQRLGVRAVGEGEVGVSIARGVRVLGVSELSQLSRLVSVGVP